MAAPLLTRREIGVAIVQATDWPDDHVQDTVASMSDATLVEWARDIGVVVGGVRRP